MEICYIEQVANIIGDRWNIIIFRELQKESMSFGNLKRNLAPITAKTLTIKLKKLQELNIISRTELKEKKQLVIYDFTNIGKELFPVLDEIKTFGNKYYSKIENS